jgi:hypothetical protein
VQKVTQSDLVYLQRLARIEKKKERRKAGGEKEHVKEA